MSREVSPKIAPQSRPGPLPCSRRSHTRTPRGHNSVDRRLDGGKLFAMAACRRASRFRLFASCRSRNAGFSPTPYLFQSSRQDMCTANEEVQYAWRLVFPLHSNKTYTTITTHAHACRQRQPLHSHGALLAPTAGAVRAPRTPVP